MSLTETSEKVRAGVVISGIVIVLYYIGLLVLFPLGKNLFASMFPERDPATPIYGMLPPLEFIEKDISDSEIPIYHLDTRDGKLPGDVPKKLTVYKFQTPIPSFEKGKNAVETASFLGFNDDDLITSLKEATYRWRSFNSGGLLDINTDTKALVLKTNLQGKSSFYPIGQLNEKTAKQYAENMFKSIQRFNDPLYTAGYSTVNFGKYSGTRLLAASLPSDAQIARVDFFRTINNLPIFGPDPKKGLLYTYLRRPSNEQPYYNYPIAESHVWEVQQQSNATYPIITAEQAWRIVSENKAVIVNVIPKNSNNVVDYTPIKIEDIFVQNVYLAYYDTPTLQTYLQPIYVFEGIYTTKGTQGGTIALYYPAVIPDYITAP